VDAVVGCSDFESIARVLDDVEGGLRPFVCREPTTLYDDTSPRVLGTPAHLAYVKIAEGCDNRCAYCTIPTLRGRLRSRALDSVVREVENLVAFGVREINLIAQDTTAYGTDIASDVALPALLSALDDTRAPWIRVLYTHPAHVGDELLSAIAELDSVVPYLDMPIQHIADAVLERMGRATDGDRIRSIVSRARELVPGIAIRSSVMTGFPGETETDFQELYEFIEAGNLDHLGVFEFSPEEGTRAHDLPDRVPASTASMRARTLIEAMEGVTERRGREMIGNDVVVLVDASEGDELEARTAGQAWEMDGIVQVDLAAVPGVSAALPTGETGVAGHCLRPGEFTTVTITGANGFDLVARPAAGAPGSDREGETA
jgi:ribosomal protein S12 methylthiotransferase